MSNWDSQIIADAMIIDEDDEDTSYEELCRQQEVNE